MSENKNQSSGSSNSAEPSKTVYKLLPVEEFTEDSRYIVTIDGKEIGVFKINGEFYAIKNHCCHQGGPLCEGKITGTVDIDEEGEKKYVQRDQIIVCPWHGWEFDLETGEHLPPTEYKVPTYEVKVKDEIVYLIV